MFSAKFDQIWMLDHILIAKSFFVHLDTSSLRKSSKFEWGSRFLKMLGETRSNGVCVWVSTLLRKNFVKVYNSAQ